MSTLIKNCQLLNQPNPVDVRLLAGRVDSIQTTLKEANNESVIDAKGGLLMPGLHDHHIHLVSLAASLASVQCGPPQVTDKEQLKELLIRENLHQTTHWLRGIGYHNSVAGDIDRHWLDKFIPDRPARIQHRGGRLWILNSQALKAIGLLNSASTTLPTGIDYDDNGPTGRLYECDQWLREQLNDGFPNLATASQHLASQGITSITDTTPSNSSEEWAYFKQSQQNGSLRQKVRMMGDLSLPTEHQSAQLQSGEYKIHLLETELPDMDTLIKNIQHAHELGRNVAVHCVTHTELVFTVACLESAAVMPGDRIEHASVTTPEMLEKIAALGLRVVSQPHFIHERGEHYIAEVDQHDQPWLYRLRGFINAGVPLAAGSDAPFGAVAPWQSMQSAVNRLTTKGNLIAHEEMLLPETALQLYMSPLAEPGVTHRSVTVGSEADLCLLSAAWETLSQDLSKATVMATWVDGELIHRKD